MKKTYIYLIRHGEVDNPNRIIYGRLPRYGLNDQGFLQIEKLGEYFKRIKLDAVYSSPLLRARQTVKAVQEYQPRVKVHYSKALLEINNKRWEGLVWTERDPKLVKMYRDTPTKLKGKGFEPLVDLEKRVSKKIDQIVEKHAGEKVAIFSHADTIRVAALHYRDEPLDKLHEIACTNASITTLVFNGGKLVKSGYKEIHPRADESYWTKTSKKLA